MKLLTGNLINSSSELTLIGQTRVICHLYFRRKLKVGYPSPFWNSKCGTNCVRRSFFLFPFTVSFVSDIAVFVMKRDVKLQPTFHRFLFFVYVSSVFLLSGFLKYLEVTITTWSPSLYDECTPTSGAGSLFGLCVHLTANTHQTFGFCAISRCQIRDDARRNYNGCHYKSLSPIHPCNCSHCQLFCIRVGGPTGGMVCVYLYIIFIYSVALAMPIVQVFTEAWKIRG